MIVKTSLVILISGIAWLKGVSGASYSKVYMERDVAPVEYYRYGPPPVPNAHLSQINSGPVQFSMPPVPGLVSSCGSPCIIPSQTVASVAPSTNVITYKSPISSVPMVVTPTQDEPLGYEYSYVVYDENTGDHKAQRELSDGSVVRGEYSFIQPDGYVREVKYVADDVTGFNAIVKNFLPMAVESKKKVEVEEKKESRTPCHEVKNESIKEGSEEETDDASKEKLGNLKVHHDVKHKESSEETKEESEESRENSKLKESGEKSEEPEKSKDKHEKRYKKESKESEEETKEEHGKKHKKESGQPKEESEEEAKEKHSKKHIKESGESKEEPAEESKEQHGKKHEQESEDSKQESEEKSKEKHAKEHIKESGESKEKSEEETKEKNGKNHEKESGESKEESEKKNKETHGKKHEKESGDSKEESDAESKKLHSKQHIKESKASSEDESEEKPKQNPQEKSKKESRESKESSEEETKEKHHKETIEAKESNSESKEKTNEEFKELKEILSLATHSNHLAPLNHELAEPENEDVVPYHDIVRCVQAAISRGNESPSAPREETSPLTYIILNKPC